MTLVNFSYSTRKINQNYKSQLEAFATSCMEKKLKQTTNLYFVLVCKFYVWLQAYNPGG